MNETESPGLARGRAAVGVRWGLVGSVLGLGAQVFYTAVVSRVVEPKEFGVIVGAQLIIRFVTYWTQGGVAPLIVQTPSVDERFLRSCMTSALLLSSTGAILLTLGSPIAARAFHIEGLAPVILALALSLIPGSAGGVGSALLRRRFAFKKLAAIDLISYLIGYLGIGLTLALAGWQRWSLVIAIVSQATISACAILAAARFPLRPILDWGAIRAITQYSARYSLTSFVQFLGISTDTFAVARYLGAPTLGQYSRAQLVGSLPMDRLSVVVSGVLFPSFAREESGSSAEKRGLVNGYGLTAIVLFVWTGLFAAAAQDVIPILLGPGWSQAVLVAPLVTLGGALQLLCVVPGAYLDANGLISRKLTIEFGSLVVAVVFITAAVSAGFGPRGFAILWVARELIRSIVLLAFGVRIYSGAIATCLVQAAMLGSSVYVVALLPGLVEIGPGWRLACRIVLTVGVGLVWLRLGRRLSVVASALDQSTLAALLGGRASTFILRMTRANSANDR